MPVSDRSSYDSEEIIPEENIPELIKTKEIVESDSDSDDVPISQRRSRLNSTSSISDVLLTNDKSINNLPDLDGSDSDSDQPLSRRILSTNSSQSILSRKRKIKTESDNTVTNEGNNSESEDDIALSKRKKVTPLKKVKKEIKKEIKKEVKRPIKRNRIKKEEDEKPSSKRKKTQTKVKEEKVSKRKKKKEEEEEEVFRWWDNENEDDSIKWTTLEHQGPFFPPEYVSHGIKMKYKGEPIDLDPECEEVANFYAQVIGTDWGENLTFRKNFFKDFLKLLKKKMPGCPIKKFEDCDFTPLTEYFAELKEKKKAMTKEEKEVIKKEKKEIEDKYGWALLDGRKEKVGNFRIEPPGLFRGRGEHPKTGTLKKLLAYNRANRQVAILCNHQRAVSKNHNDQLKRIQDKILTSKYQRYLVSKEILEIDPTLKKKKPEYGRLSRGITKAFIKNYEEKELEKKKAKLEKDNEKRKKEGKELLTLEDVEKKKHQPSLERLQKQYDVLSKRIKAQQLLLIDKDENKTTALGTSKINYIDPRISAAWCYKYNVPIEKIFNKSLRNKFKWAVEVDENFVF
ncbi:hypothetical protein LY90DRAFT_666967 [Neocallimastix californiae]|uniref:DNA topoisomerase 1 n=1 Tax=Neocallimastix californiae TaxID=1754190 RepID=A0A1Y2EMU7_9FUNG|nr:hypothetical protein LY90DRAFT_666967 [Neocallimastix californiae]|eukprot:ORY72867.1 hypothetical protein LY90DRAFT_666967 [Neocallimastix californiae]